jgi:hypothetical protein
MYDLDGLSEIHLAPKGTLKWLIVAGLLSVVLVGGGYVLIKKWRARRA